MLRRNRLTFHSSGRLRRRLIPALGLMQQLSKIRASDRANLSIVLANVLGAAIYLWFSVPLWAPAELANEPGAGVGDPIIWGFTALPTLALFVLVNFVWLLWAGTMFFVRRRWLVKIIYLAVPVLWVVTLFVDFSHHWAM
jgi:hypothetical protein